MADIAQEALVHFDVLIILRKKEEKKGVRFEMISSVLD
jgi:hypothetical protein